MIGVKLLGIGAILFFAGMVAATTCPHRGYRSHHGHYTVAWVCFVAAFVSAIVGVLALP